MRRLQRLKNNAIYALVALLSAGLNALPLKVSRALGAGLGRLFYLLVRYEREKALRQLAIAFPGWSPPQRRRLCAEVFSNLGRSATELFRFTTLRPADLEAWVSEVEGLQNIEKARSSGRGVVFVTAHAGHWELLAAWTAQRLKVGVAARPLYDPRFDARLNATRAHMGITVFPRGATARPILRWLKDGHTLGTLADQDTGVDSLYVPYFGREAKTPSGPAWLAAVTGALLMTAFCRRGPDGRYILRFDAEVPVDPEGARSKAALLPAVAEYTRRTEAFVREYPAQWAWMHERWRSKKEEKSTGWDPAESLLLEPRSSH